MKAKVDQLSRQLEQQSAPAPARPLTPAEARAKAAEERRQAESKAREERQAKAAEAQRLAAERKARAEEEKREQAEARAREVEARATEARRQAEERRANEEAARRQAEEQRARQETERREAAERAREAEAARVARRRPRPGSRPPRSLRAQRPAPRWPKGRSGPGCTAAAPATRSTSSWWATRWSSRSVPTTARPSTGPRRRDPGCMGTGTRTPGTHFALTVQDNTTLVASRFSGSGEVLPNGTPLRFAAGAAEAQPVSRSTFAAMDERAQHYLRLAQTDPSNAQAWSFCGMAAMAQAHDQNEAQVRQAAMALKSIATTARSPCGEVITDSLWRSLPCYKGRPPPSTREDALRARAAAQATTGEPLDRPCVRRSANGRSWPEAAVPQADLAATPLAVFGEALPLVLFRSPAQPADSLVPEVCGRRRVPAGTSPQP